MSTERDEVLKEANELGIEFKTNIPTSKLRIKIAEFKGEPPPNLESAPPSPAAKTPAAVVEEEDEKVTLTTAEKAHNAVRDKFVAARMRVAEAKRKAFQKQVVTVTNKDNRENDVMTTTYVGFENQHFGISRLVPLDVPVELEQALINILESTTITLHKDEIKHGKRTGNKVPTRVKKFAISYGKHIE